MSRRINTYFLSRHPGEGRGPELQEPAAPVSLDSGFRRNDDNFFSVSCALSAVQYLEIIGITLRKNKKTDEQTIKSPRRGGK
jgi:hypothetical protein